MNLRGPAAHAEHFWKLVMYSIALLVGRGRIAACVAAFTCIAVPAHAGNTLDEDGFEDHHAHEHGAATLNVAAEGQRLSIEFASPAVNVVGFEHAPRSEAERAAAKKAESLLRDAGKAFGLPAAADCRTVASELSAPEWHEDQDHADYEAKYEFTCRQPAALTQLTVSFLGKLASATKLRVQLVTPSKQVSSELSGNNNVLTLR